MEFTIGTGPDGTAVITGGIFRGNAGERKIWIPETLNGRTVTAVGAHAFSGNHTVREITLPGTLRSVGAYAFYDCANLRRLILTDSITDWNDGAVRECASLRVAEVAVRQGNYRVLKDLLGDTDAALVIRLRLPDGEAQLYFPGYYDEASEDTHARAFHHTIVGAGYTYRQCVTRRGVDLREYDRVFDKAVAAGWRTASLIAASRLEFPRQLPDGMKRRYEDCLLENAGQALPYFAAHGMTGAVRTCSEARKSVIGRDAGGDAAEPERARFRENFEEGLREALRAASEKGYAAICGILMDAQREGASGGKPRMLSLDDF